jgi:hypothetical protein
MLVPFFEFVRLSAEMEETFSDFSAFVTKYNNDNYEAMMSSASKGYGKALKALRERELFELQLTQSSGSYEVYSAYLEFELSSAKVQIPRLTQTLFERILGIFWQQQPVWLEYGSYAVRTMFQRIRLLTLSRCRKNLTRRKLHP